MMLYRHGWHAHLASSHILASVRLLAGLVEGGWRRQFVYGLLILSIMTNLVYVLGVPLALFRLYILVAALVSLLLLSALGGGKPSPARGADLRLGVAVGCGLAGRRAVRRALGRSQAGRVAPRLGARGPWRLCSSLVCSGTSCVGAGSGLCAALCCATLPCLVATPRLWCSAWPGCVTSLSGS